MKKRIFISYWFYFLGGIILVLGSMGLVIFEIVQILTISKEVNPTIIYSYYFFPLLVLLMFYMTFIAGYLLFQFIILTEEGIKVKCLWGTIRKLKWEEVKELRLEKFYVSTPGAFTAKWYVFDDGVNRKFTNGIASKKSHITLPYSKHKQKAIEEFWKGEIVEKILK